MQTARQRRLIVQSNSVELSFAGTILMKNLVAKTDFSEVPVTFPFCESRFSQAAI